MTMRQAAGGAGDLDEPKRTTEDGLEPEGRDSDAGPESGAAPAIKGTSLGGPTGGTVVGASEGSLGTMADRDPDRTAHEDHEEPR